MSNKLVAAWVLGMAVMAFAAAPVTADTGATATRHAYILTSPQGAVSLAIPDAIIPSLALPIPTADVLANKTRVIVSLPATENDPDLVPYLEGVLHPKALLHRLLRGTMSRAPWAESLTDTQVAELRRRAICAFRWAADIGLSDDEVITFAQYYFDRGLARMEPSFLTGIAASPCRPGKNYGLEHVIYGMARDKGVPVLGLSTLVSMEQSLDGIPSDMVVRMMTDYYLTPVYEHHLRLLDDALKSGTIAEQMRVLENDPLFLRLDPEGHIRARELELKRDWYAKSLPHLEKGNALVIMPASALAGEHGLLELIERDGYRIEPTMIPASAANPVQP